MKKTTGFYPRVHVDSAGTGVVSHAGGVLLAETVRVAGLDRALSAGLARWRKPFAVHDPAKVVTDLAIGLALGGDCLADVALLRAEPGVFGPVASDPTVSRAIDTLAKDAPRALAAINAARAAARAQVWKLAGEPATDIAASSASPLVIDVDATLVTAHSDKESAAPTFKRGYGFHPLWAFADHGPGGTGEPLAVLLRAGNAGSNTAADHIAVIRDALRQLPTHRSGRRAGRRVLIRIDGAGATHELLDWLVTQRLSYSIGFTLPTDALPLIAKIPKAVWTPAYDADGEIRDGAWVAELTDLLELSGWPAGMRVIARKERPHPGAQLRLTDVDGNRITAFATNTTAGGPGTGLADLELRHRRRARCEDRIRTAKDTGLTNLPLHDFTQNQIWCAIVALACEITAWMQTLALTGHPARRWEPNGCGCACSPSPGAWPPPAAEPSCTCPPTPPGPTWPPPPSLTYERTPPPADQRQHPARPNAPHHREWNPAPSPSDNGPSRHTHTPESALTAPPQAGIRPANQGAKDPG